MRGGNINPKIESVKKYFKGWSIALVVFVVLYLSFFTVKFVPNEHFVNETLPDNRTVTVAKVYYDRADIVPIKMFGENDLSYLGFSQIGFVLLGILIYIFVTNYPKDYVDMLPIRVHQQMILDEYKSNPNVDTIQVFDQAYTQFEKVHDEPSKPFKRMIPIQVKFRDTMNDEAGEHYKWIICNPFKEQMYEKWESVDYPDMTPKCPSCGRFPDFRVETPEGLKELKDKWLIKPGGN